MTERDQGTETDESELIAAIDIGTNSVHLVVARTLGTSGYEVVTTQKEVVRLGSGSGDMKLLAPDAIDRGIAALTRMADVAHSLGATVYAVATSAVREATNRNEFLERARIEAGVEVEVISGFEEARLIHLGILKALPVFDKRIMAFDIGGGSTEIVAGEGSELLAARSFRLGAIRLTERFFPGGNVAGEEAVERCRAFVRQTLAGVRVEFVGHQPELLIASSGTAATLTAMAAAQEASDPASLNGATITAAHRQNSRRQEGEDSRPRQEAERHHSGWSHSCPASSRTQRSRWIHLQRIGLTGGRPGGPFTRRCSRPPP